MKRKKDSRYLEDIRPLLQRAYGPQRAKSMLDDAWKRYEEICAENATEPGKMHMHTRKRIYPAIAAFDALIAGGVPRQEAADFLNGYYIRRAESVGAKIRKAMRIPGLYRLVPKFFAKMTAGSFGQAAGFQADWHSATWREMRFDMRACPYQDKCVQYGCPEIVQGFCRADDVCYGSMHPRLRWGRTKTLGMGGDCCDFRLTAVRRGKPA